VRRLFIVLFCLFTAYTVTAQQNYHIKDKIYLPPNYFVGDRVELRLQINVKEGTTVRKPDNIPETEWADIQDINVTKRDKDYEVRIGVVPYRPGTLRLPPIQLGDVVIRNQTIYTDALLESGNYGFENTKGPLLLPYTKAAIGFAVGGISVLLLFLLWFNTMGITRIREMIRKYRERGPYRKCLSRLRSLEKQSLAMETDSFYVTLSQIIREYLSRRTPINFFATTTSENRQLLSGYLTESSGLGTALELFQQIDRVKYATYESDSEKRKGHVNTARVLVENMEYSISGRANKEKSEEENNKEEAENVDV